MLISHKHKFIFIAVPKTATATIRYLLESYSDIVSKGTTPPYDWHCTAPDLKKHFQGQNWDWDQYFKFAFVRNPWDRLVSEFFYRKKRIKIFEGSNEKPQYIMDSEKMFNEVGTFSGWVKSKYINAAAPVVPPQHKYIFDETDERLVDFVGRFENLPTSAETACNKIGIKYKPAKISNSTDHMSYTEYYDDETRQIVAERYAKDIKRFGYEFGK